MRLGRRSPSRTSRTETEFERRGEEGARWKAQHTDTVKKTRGHLRQKGHDCAHNLVLCSQCTQSARGALWRVHCGVVHSRVVCVRRACVACARCAALRVAALRVAHCAWHSFILSFTHSFIHSSTHSFFLSFLSFFLSSLSLFFSSLSLFLSLFSSPLFSSLISFVSLSSLSLPVLLVHFSYQVPGHGFGK